MHPWVLFAHDAQVLFVEQQLLAMTRWESAIEADHQIDRALFEIGWNIVKAPGPNGEVHLRGLALEQT